MAKKPLNVEQGVQLDKQGSARTYNERDEGLLYNNQNLGIRVQTEGADRELLTDTQTQAIQNKSLDNTNSVVIKDTNLTIEDQSSPTKNIKFDVASVSTSQVFRFPDTTDEIVTKNFAQTISGKSIDADTNTISNLEVDNLKSGVLLTTTVSVSINDANLFSAKAIKDYVDQQDTANSGALTNHINDTVDAHDASAISSVASGNLAATDVQSALNELQSDIDTRELTSNKGAVNGYCPLGADQKVPAANLPSYVDDIEEYANLAAFPVTGESGKLYLALDTSLLYRWSGSVYAEVSQSLALGETSTTAYRGDRGATAYSHSQATSGTHGITGSFVGTTDTQVITNKDIDGGVAANTRRITFPSDTLANLNALTRKEGTVVYATDTDKLYYDNGSILTAVGSGSGSGDLATYTQLKSDDDIGTWSTGNNATFLGGGSIAGTFTKQNATSPLNGTYSYTLVQAAGSLNDYIASDVQTVPLRSRGVTNSTDLVYTYDGSDNDIKWVVYDVTNATVVTPVTAYVKASSVGKTAQLVYDLPVTCTQVRFGAQIVVANSGKTLKFDDVQLSAWTPQAVNLVEQGFFYAYGNTGTSVTANVTDIPFTTISKNSIPSTLGSWSNSTTYTALKKQNVVINARSEYTSNTNRALSVYKNNVDQKTYGANSGTGSSLVSVSIEMNAGDYITIREVGSGGTLSNSPAHNIFFTASAISENVVQSWQDGMATWSATSTIQIGATTTAPTKGTTDLDQVRFVRNGADVLFWYQYNQTGAGTAGSGDYLFSLPSGLQFNPNYVTYYTTIEGGADAWTPKNAIPAGTLGVTGGYMYSLYVIPYDATRFRLGMIGGVQASTISNGVMGSGFQGLSAASNSFSFKFSASILGISSTPTLLALPSSKENVFSARISSTGVKTSQNVDWIDSVTVSDTSLYTINISKLGLTSAPQVNANVLGTWTSSQAPRWATVQSVTATSIVIRTGSLSSGLNQYEAAPFEIKIQKQSPDYTAPGVFVGQLSGQWQYDISSYVTSSPAVSSMARAVAVVTKCDSGQYRMEFNIVYSVASGSRTTCIATISGCTFKALTGLAQQVGSWTSAVVAQNCYTQQNTGQIQIDHASATTTSYGFSGKVELESKPTWATMTP